MTLCTAVIDTGVDWDHPDLAANIWTNEGEIAGDSLDNDGNGYIDDAGDGILLRLIPVQCTTGKTLLHLIMIPWMFKDMELTVQELSGQSPITGFGITGVTWNCKVMAVRAGYKDTSGKGPCSILIFPPQSSMQLTVEQT